MKAGEALVVVRSVNGDVLHAVLVELSHELVEVFLTAFFTKFFSREVGMHAGTVPVAFEWLAVVIHVDSILFAETFKKEAGNPNLVGGALGSFSENLKFPLAHSHFSVDAFVVDAGVEAEVEVLVDDGTTDVAHVLVANSAVVSTLRLGISAFRESEDVAVFFEEVFLLKSEPCVFIVEDARASVGGMRIAVGKHNFTHDEDTVLTGSVRIKRDWLEDAVGVASVSLLGGGSVKSPLGQLLESREVIKFLDAAFSTKVWDGRVAVQPDVIESVFSHWSDWLLENCDSVQKCAGGSMKIGRLAIPYLQFPVKSKQLACQVL